MSVLHSQPSAGGSAYVLISSNGLVDVAGRELIELFVMSKYYDSHIDLAQHRKFVGLLEKTTLSLQEGAALGQRRSVFVLDICKKANLHGTIAIILDSLDLNFPTTHCRVGCTCAGL